MVFCDGYYRLIFETRGVGCVDRVFFDGRYVSVFRDSSFEPVRFDVSFLSDLPSLDGSVAGADLGFSFVNGSLEVLLDKL